MGFFNGEPLEAQGSFIARLMVQLVLILTIPRILHITVFQRFWQPRVISEIVSGIVLGPTCLGLIPGFTDNIFPKRSIPYLNALGQMGAILYLLMVGVSVDIEKFKKLWKEAIAASSLGLGLCLAIAPGLHLAFDSPDYINANQVEFIILIADILFISALAVLARILAERKMLVTTLGSITMSTTAMDTLYGWILLATVLALYTARVPIVPPDDNSCGVVFVSPADAESEMDPLYIVLTFVGLLVVLVLPVRYAMTYLAERAQRRDKLEAATFYAVVTMTFAVAWFTQTLTISGMFGAFLVGVLSVPRVGPLPALLRTSLEKIVVVILLPIFFAVSGLRTDWTILDGEAVGLAFLLVASVYVTKSLGCFAAAYVLGVRGFKLLYFAGLMSAKGLTVIAFLNICLDIGIVTQKMFSLCILFALVSTIAASPIIRLIQVFDRRHKMSRAVPVDTCPFRVLAIPRTPYYANVVMDLAFWIAADHMPSRVVAARLLHGDVGMNDMLLAQASQEELRRDEILGPAMLHADTVKADMKEAPVLELKAIGVPAGASDFVDFVTGLDDEKGERTAPYQYIVLGYDGSTLTETYISSIVTETTATVITYIGTVGKTALGFHSFETLLVVLQEDESSDDYRATRLVVGSLLTHHTRMKVNTVYAPRSSKPEERRNQGEVEMMEIVVSDNGDAVPRNSMHQPEVLLSEVGGHKGERSSDKGEEELEVPLEDDERGEIKPPRWAEEVLGKSVQSIKLDWSHGLKGALEGLPGNPDKTLVILPRIYDNASVEEYLIMLMDLPCVALYVESHASENAPEELNDVGARQS